MRRFQLPQELEKVGYQQKHDYVKDFIRGFIDKKKDGKNYKHGQRFWDTYLVLELLELLNLTPVHENFLHKKYDADFLVKCTIHKDLPPIDRSLAKINKGHICPHCLLTTRCLTQEEAKGLAEKHGYELLETYKGYHEEHLLRCPRGHIDNLIFLSILHDRCRTCGIEKKKEKLRLSFDDIEQDFVELQKEYSNIQLLTTKKEYENFRGTSNKFHLRYTCYICCEPKKSTVADFKTGYLMCQKCVGEVINSGRRLSYIEISSRLKKKNLQIVTTEDEFNNHYKNQSYEVDYYCIKCNHPNNKRVADLLVSGCPICNPKYFGKTNHKIQTWSDKVKKRDNYQCFNCGYQGKELDSHHIYGKKGYPELITVLENGVTLCSCCHRFSKYSYHRYLNKQKLIHPTPNSFFLWLINLGELSTQDSYETFDCVDFNVIPPRMRYPEMNKLRTNITLLEAQVLSRKKSNSL